MRFNYTLIASLMSKRLRVYFTNKLTIPNIASSFESDRHGTAIDFGGECVAPMDVATRT